MSCERAAALVVLTLIVAACASVKVEDAPYAPPGNVERGREVFVSREGGHCVLCHALPGIAVAGDVGPPLAGIGSRLTPGEVRARVADITRVNPQAVMPAFHRTANLNRVAPAQAGKPILSAQQVEDVVAFLINWGTTPINSTPIHR